MIDIESKPFGKIQIRQEQLLEFPEGLLGFESYKKYALIEESEESPFKWLQSLQETSLAFIVIQPELFLENYKPLVPEDELLTIGLKSVEEALCFLIVTIPRERPHDMTANLQGPILINRTNHLGKQFISRDDRHPVRFKILEANS